MGGAIKAIGGVFGGKSGSKDDTKKQLDKMEVDFMISQFESRAKAEKKKLFAKDPNDQFY